MKMHVQGFVQTMLPSVPGTLFPFWSTHQQWEPVSLQLQSLLSKVTVPAQRSHMTEAPQPPLCFCKVWPLLTRLFTHSYMLKFPQLLCGGFWAQ